MQVDFYVVSAPDSDAIRRIACRVVEKAWIKGHRVFVHTASPIDAQELDDLLWTWKQDSFVPHEIHRGGDAGAARVLVGAGAEPDGPLDVLINLTDAVPLFYARSTRVAEFVSGDPEALAAGRARYRSYRDRGCVLQKHDL